MLPEETKCPHCQSGKVTVRGKKVLTKGLLMMSGILTIVLLILGMFITPVLTTAALIVWLGGFLLIGVIRFLIPAERIEMYYCRDCDLRWLRGQF